MSRVRLRLLFTQPLKLTHPNNSTLASLSRPTGVVAGYLSPSTRLLRCARGFITEAERRFPWAVATLREVTVADKKAWDLHVKDLGARGFAPVPMTGSS